MSFVILKPFLSSISSSFTAFLSIKFVCTILRLLSGSKKKRFWQSKCQTDLGIALPTQSCLERVLTCLNRKVTFRFIRSFDVSPLKCLIRFQEVKRDYRCDWRADGHHQQGWRTAPAQPGRQQHPGNKTNTSSWVGNEYIAMCCPHHCVCALPQVISEQSDAEANAAKIPTFFPPGPLPPNIPPPPFLPPPPNVSAAPPLIPPPSTSILASFRFITC